MIVYEDNKFDFRIFKLRENFAFYSHLHKHLELFVCTEGQMTVTCERQIYTLHNDSWLIVLPETEHSIISTKEGSGIIAMVNPSLISYLTPYLYKKLPVPVIKNPNPVIKRYLQDLMTEHQGRYNKTIAKGLLYAILGNLFEQCQFEDSPTNYNGDLCYNVIKYMSDHFKSTEVTLTAIAKHFGVNSSYLSRTFNNKIGCHITDVLNGYRVDYAKYLLINTTISITDICFESGFSTLRSFNRWFDRLEKCSPKEYRKSTAG